MDTESIIRDMMTAHRLPLDKITQRKQYLEWQLDDYRSINRDLKSMSDNLFDTVMRQGTYLAKQVNISNENAVNIRSLSATSEFAGTLSIEKLATAATLHSAEGITLEGEHTVNSTLQELGIVGSEITIQAPGAETVTLTFDPAKDTLTTVLSRINKEANVTAFYDSFTGKIAMTSKNSGTGEIGVSGDLGTALKLTNGTKTEGQNAQFTFNGLETERTSNTFQINGFEITLKEVSEAPITFSSSPDTDKVLESVVKFVDDYNKLIEELNAKIKEPRYRDFQPLSDEQKAEMKEKEIELWEEKAMSGTLRNDSTIQSLLQRMRTALNGAVGTTDPKLRLSDIGITPSKNYLDNGKLVIDEDKLRQVISENPNKVYEVLGKSGENEEDRGLVGRLRTAIDDTRKVITARAGNAGAVNDTFTLGRTLKQMDSQIERFQTRMQQVEDRYWKQFTRMEMAIQRANAQSAQLMSAFGGMM